MKNSRIDFDKKILMEQNKEYVIGIDEVGWGCIAGDLILGGSLIPVDFYNDFINISQKHPLFEKIRDSKKLTEGMRSKIYKEVLDSGIFPVVIGQSSVEYINQNGLAKAYTQCIEQILQQFQDKISSSAVLIDGTRDPKTSMLKEFFLFEKGDDKSFAMGVASTVAKVYRDNLMTSLDSQYPLYGFIDNNGYGTAQHTKSLKQNGLTPVHRIGASTKIMNSSYGKE